MSRSEKYIYSRQGLHGRLYWYKIKRNLSYKKEILTALNKQNSSLHVTRL